jgi:DNA topoisomerase-3
MQAKMVERKTSPPDHLTESELISLMEKHGIGTDASIPVHINNICERNYVTILTGRKLQPTTLGIILVHGYQKVSASVLGYLVHVLPRLRTGGVFMDSVFLC